MPYTAEKPVTAPPRAVLQAKIPGWGVDVASAERPAVPKEQFNPGGMGAHWVFPERQVPIGFREKSTEHAQLTPVFGTSCPLKGLSGVIRRIAYTRSEGQNSHWLLLIFADRVDVIESRITSLFRLRPDNFVSEMGLMSEVKHHGLRSRIGAHRSDTKHLPVDVLLFTATSALKLGAIALVAAGGLSAARKLGLVAPRRRTVLERIGGLLTG